MLREELADEIISQIEELMSLMQNIRLDVYAGKNPTKKIEEALYELELLHVKLFRLYEFFVK